MFSAGQHYIGQFIDDVQRRTTLHSGQLIDDVQTAGQHIGQLIDDVQRMKHIGQLIDDVQRRTTHRPINRRCSAQDNTWAN